ncbi:MAG TPA: hypothetical protein VFP49_04425 [Nitrososphaeraceae archaeon]|nr:hypothetical protein [Nitrososphaeraceae archaeon]
MILTKSWIIGLVLGISIVLLTSTPFQVNTNHLKKDSIFLPSSNEANFVFAQTNGEANGDTTEPPAEELPAEELPAEEPPAEELPEEEPPAEPQNGNNTPHPLHHRHHLHLAITPPPRTT